MNEPLDADVGGKPSKGALTDGDRKGIVGRGELNAGDVRAELSVGFRW